MKIDKVKVKHAHGIHLRVAAELARICKRHSSTVVVSCRDCPEANACSILQLLMLGATEGTELIVKAEGEDEKEAVQAIRRFLLNIENGRMQ